MKTLGQAKSGFNKLGRFTKQLQFDATLSLGFEMISEWLALSMHSLEILWPIPATYKEFHDNYLF